MTQWGIFEGWHRTAKNYHKVPNFLCQFKEHCMRARFIMIFVEETSDFIQNWCFIMKI